MQDSQSVQDADKELEKENEEKDHEIDGTVIPERFVGGPEPAHERERRKEDEIDEGQAECDPDVPAGEHVDKAHHHVGEQQTHVRWKKNEKNYISIVCKRGK